MMKPLWKRVLAVPALTAVSLLATSCSAPQSAPLEEGAPLSQNAPAADAQPVAATDGTATNGKAEVTPGKAAPDFTLTDTNGKSHKLSDFRGKYVVLEWLNHGCPFVKKHYGGGNMQRLQKMAREKDVVWLSIVSSKPGTQGHYPPAEHNKMAEEMGGAATAILIDESSDVGRLYKAKTTPHMFVISPEGILLYNGAIDDKPTTDKADLEGAKNYVQIALDEAQAGKKVTTSVTQPYGCSVKY